MVRTFIGIELNANTVNEIAEELNYLSYHFPKINWVRPENLHITLKFLGNVIPNDLRNIFDNITYVGSKSSPFSLDIQSVGLLPNEKHPRIVYAGCAMGEDCLKRLHKEVNDIISSIGYPEEPRPYYPHITLGRIKKPSYALGIEEYLRDLQKINFGITDIDEIVVFMSELKNKGAVYSPMYRIKLEG